MPREDLAESLHEFLDSQVMDVVESEKQKFVIDDDNKANWAIRKIIKLQHKNEDAKKLADEQIAKIKQWQADIETECNSSIGFFTNLLRPYAEQQLEGKSKTVKLPNGNVSFRSVDPEFFISGEKVSGKNKTLTERVEQLAPELIITEKSTDWTEFKNTLTVMEDGRVISATGEILDFIEAIEYPDSLTVKERK
ncbi:hypothetical protein Ga0466249_005256 [Sporomusaceae bacterium BoRhaA]|uniref:host-nuclease inhibitor Gam family protein n=1 Tax=Pelorhabdus rhamnosifermentans TaxID=2772457 RepID=UPI001C05F937|nr:host-nuclease inhibitor Gam family protein [Pelorhabdus rhamnosifermentans]MBU2704103.1 hypothetical protein [Pelorhabdus rhamnosifermentans]